MHQGFLLSAALAFIIFPLTLFILHTIAKKRRNFSEKPLPSPPKLPFIGNLHQIGALPHQSLYSLSLKHGDLMLVQLGEARYVVVSSSDMACAVMRTHDLAFASRPSSVVSKIMVFRNTSFEPYGVEWRELRKVITIHLLSTKRLNSYQTIREEEVGNLIQKISNHFSMPKSNPINLSKILFSSLNNLVCRVVSGKFFIEEGRYDLFMELLEEGFYLIGQFSVGDLFPSFSWLEGLIGLSRRAKRFKYRWNMFLEEVIQAHMQRGEDEKKQESFVDVILSLKNDPNVGFDFSMEHVKGLIADAIAAGIDTTYVTLDWAMSELIKNPPLMKKLQDEVRRSANQENMVRSEELNQMSYLKAVIKETLRLHPPLPLLLPRQAMEQCEINGFTIPKGTKVLVNAWAIGREAKSWEAPEEFRPERFLDSEVDYKGNNFQFIPFGAGRRICPGLQFAVATAELALANLVHRFDWELPCGATTNALDMSEAPGLTVHRKDNLQLVAKQVYF